MVGLSQSGSVELLLVYHMSRWAIFFWCDHHSQTPCCGHTYCYWFDNAQCHISVKVLFDPFFQWYGTGIGMWTAVGLVPGMKVMSRYLPFIVWSCWWGHVLNALALKCSNTHSFSWRLFSYVGSNGMSTDLVGTIVLQGHPHEAFPSLLMATFCCEVKVGKSGGSRPNFFKAYSDRLASPPPPPGLLSWIGHSFFWAASYTLWLQRYGILPLLHSLLICWQIFVFSTLFPCVQIFHS